MLFQKARCIANAILVQDRINGGSPDTLRSLIAKYPEFEKKFRNYYSSQHGVTIPPTVVVQEES
jgi:hypothetical protein